MLVIVVPFANTNNRGFWLMLLLMLSFLTSVELNQAGPTCLLREELLCVFPVVNLLMSPSNSLKTLASRFLSMVNGLIIDLVSSHHSEENACTKWTPVGPQSSALLRLYHLLFEVISGFILFLNFY